jgi:hypothetical protein
MTLVVPISKRLSRLVPAKGSSRVVPVLPVRRRSLMATALTRRRGVAKFEDDGPQNAMELSRTRDGVAHFVLVKLGQP